MKRLGRNFKSYLKDLTQTLQGRLKDKVRDPRLRLKPVTIYQSDTFGWVSDILRLEQIPGTLQLWLDLFPNIGRPVLSVCYYNGDLNRVKKVAEAFTGHQHKEVDLSIRHCGLRVKGCRVLAKPLQKKYFGKPLVESYVVESYESNFFTVYFPDHIKAHGQNVASFVGRISRLSERLIRATASALETRSTQQSDYVGFENRKIVAQHIRRERSQKLARMAKTRDGFSCRVCQFNFADTYGELGRGFAESHHLVPLSSLRRRIQTRVKDLITVCANCHRMLHQMDGYPSDVKRLRRSVRRGK